MIVLVAVSVAGATPVVGREPLRVLFVGNSYTYYNNLPDVVAGMASEVPGAAPVVTGRVTYGGATLAGHWRGGAAVDSIRTGCWDMVVLLFRDGVEGQGAETVLLLTWAREGAPEQQAGRDHAYVSVARELDLRLVPVGRVWARVREALPDAGLYSPDGSHPSSRGTWVAAATTVATILEAHAVETLPGSIRTDSMDGRGEAVPGRTSRLEVPAAFVRVVGRAVGEELAELRAAGGYRLTDRPGMEAYPDWTPGGRWLVFILCDGDNEIYDMRPDGSEARNLTDHPAEDNGPRISPDGRRIVFFSNRDGNFEIYGSELRSLTGPGAGEHADPGATRH